MSERGCLCRAHNSQHTYCYESCGQAGCTLNAGSFESRAGSSMPEAARAADDVGKARQLCDPHHWVSRHQPDFPVFWVDQCSLCGDYNAERMQEQIDAVIAAAVAEERATTGRALARIKSERLGNRPTGPARDERMFNAGLDAAEAILRAALASPGEES